MKGVRSDGRGLRVYVKVGHGEHAKQIEKRYPFGTDAQTIKAWQDEARVALRKSSAIVATRRDALEADAVRYLKQVAHLTSYKSRICEIMAWVRLYGERRRVSLTPEDVRLARVQWLDDDYAPKTINHRVRALRHLYRLLDGARAGSPCDDIEPLQEPAAQPVAVPIATIKKVARAIGDPKTRARFKVLVSTGQRPAQLKRAEQTDVDIRRRLWLVRPAKRGNWIPVVLTDDMVAAWQEFIAVDAFGPFDSSDYAKALYVAGWPKDVRPYNAKHTMALTLAEAGAEWEDIRDFFGHTDIKTTRIYTGVVQSRLRRVSRLLNGRFGWKPKRQKKAG